MNGQGPLPQPHRYVAGIHLLRALREGNKPSWAHPLQPEINSSPGPKDYGIFLPGTWPFFQRTGSWEVGIWALAPNLLCRGLSQRQDCISFPIPGLPSSTLGSSETLPGLASPSPPQSRAKTGACPGGSLWH